MRRDAGQNRGDAVEKRGRSTQRPWLEGRTLVSVLARLLTTM